MNEEKETKKFAAQIIKLTIHRPDHKRYRPFADMTDQMRYRSMRDRDHIFQQRMNDSRLALATHWFRINFARIHQCSMWPPAR